MDAKDVWKSRRAVASSANSWIFPAGHSGCDLLWQRSGDPGGERRMGTDKDVDDPQDRPPPGFDPREAIIFGALIALLAALTYLDNI
ncbi:hypothetical protein [Rhodococcus sp. JS3073]|uniref:hypothetical protein n=1 Tax=Rhodococcus sp. JS3073 TaxID=3002901 RepID=UPI002285F499|nr:hypothetical protein [Rhodococcus sp. JS3073]WAM19082.1 hypothetical protein OYT95_41790 [Rhodococcus sp. JS3073]